MYDQLQELRAENKALKDQINEIIITRPNHQRHAGVKTQVQPSNISESDISSTDNEREDDTPSWVTVLKRGIKRKPDKLYSNKSVNYHRNKRTTFQNDSREPRTERLSKTQETEERQKSATKDNHHYGLQNRERNTQRDIYNYARKSYPRFRRTETFHVSSAYMTDKGFDFGNSVTTR